MRNLEGSPGRGHHMSDQRRENMGDGFVQECDNGHPKDPELESNKNEVFTLGVVEPGINQRQKLYDRVTLSTHTDTGQFNAQRQLVSKVAGMLLKPMPLMLTLF